MEPLEATAAAAVSYMDELLLDFSSGDIVDSAPPPPPPPPHSRLRRVAETAPPPSHHRGNPRLTAGATIIHPSPLDAPTTALMEEELEWLSNKDAFPTLETFDIPSPRKPPSSLENPKRPSPVSVLDGAAAAAEAPPPLFLRVPGRRARSKARRRRRRVLPVFGSPEEEAEYGGGKRRCGHCQAEETPQWRTGPNGPKTLCNACGVRFKSGRLVPEYRPASSPSFSRELHSNSHRMIMEMRRRKEKPTPAAAAAAVPAMTMTKKKRGLRLQPHHQS